MVFSLVICRPVSVVTTPHTANIFSAKESQLQVLFKIQINQYELWQVPE